MERKKVFSRVGIILLVATVGGGAYFLKLPHRGNDKEELNFYLPRGESLAGEYQDSEKQSVNNLSNFLSRSGKKFNIVLYSPLQKNLSKEMVNTKLEPDAGVMATSHVFQLMRNGIKVHPVFEVSPHVKYACRTELQILVSKDSNINTLKDLKNKKLAIIEKANRFSILLFNDLKQNNVIFDTIYPERFASWGKDNVLNKKIDGMALAVNVLENGSDSFVRGDYQDEPNLKAISITNSHIPCRVIFLNDKLETAFQKKLINYLKNEVTTTAGLIALRSSAQIGSIKELSSEEWSKIHQSLREMSLGKSLKDFARKIDSLDRE